MILFGPVIGPSSFDIVEVDYNDSSAALADIYDQTTDLYVPELERIFLYTSYAGSDEYFCWMYGFSAITLWESLLGENPYYHEYNDLIANYLEYFPFGTNVAKSAIACIAALAVPVGLGIEEGSPEYVSVGVSPSPAGSVAFVEASGIGEAPAAVDLYDLSGRLVESVPLGPDGTAGLDVSSLQPGVYLIRVTSGDCPAGTARLVVCR